MITADVGQNIDIVLWVQKKYRYDLVALSVCEETAFSRLQRTMQSTTRMVLIPLNVKDRLLNFRMQALLLDYLTPEQTRLPQTTATSSGQSPQPPRSPTAWLWVAQILLEQDLRETLAAGPPDGRSFRSLCMSQQDDELSQISRNTLFDQLDTLITVYKTRYRNK